MAETKTNDKKWYKSKTKWAGLLGGLSAMLPGIIASLNGNYLPIMDVLGGLTIILGVFGIRDLPIINQLEKQIK